MDSDPAPAAVRRGATEVPAAVASAVTEEFAAVLDLPADRVDPDADFYAVLDGVSQQKLELLARLEDRFATTITDGEAADLHTVRDFAGLLSGRLQR